MIPSVEGILNLFYTKDMRLYSIIIPVYNRPDELDDLLSSLCKQTYVHFEVIVVEDGSTIPAKEIVRRYQERLDLHYCVISNSGPGMARNHGARQAHGEYLLILDSDVVLPSTWLEHIHDSLNHYPVDAFGGPDKAHASFSPIQKAINYAMTSFLTTGGIRGGKKKLDKFYPRSFNMGIRRDVYERLGGFSGMRYGEDIDFSIRIMEAGYRTRLFPSAWVYHKKADGSHAVLPSGASFGGGPDCVEPETSRLIEIGTLLTGIIHVFSLSIGYQFILLPLVSGASYYLCPFIVCRRNVPQ